MRGICPLYTHFRSGKIVKLKATLRTNCEKISPVIDNMENLRYLTKYCLNEWVYKNLKELQNFIFLS